MTKTPAQSSSAFQALPLDALKPGMFVVSILRQTGVTRLIQSGLIDSTAQLHQLAELGVKEVLIDPNRSHLHADLNHATPTVEAPALPPRHQPGHKTSQNARLRRLYQEAKLLQDKLFASLKAGNRIDLGPLGKIADELVDAIFENRDALLCLSRIREKDSYLMEHSLNVGILLANFGRHLGLERSVLRELTIGGLLHDTGKVLVPDEILHKPSRLTPDEFEIMKLHVKHGLKILDRSWDITPIMRTVVATHHEGLDGQGYPQGLGTEELCLYARMASIVDVYDALSADRCYKAGMHPSQALRILLQGSGSQFDPALVEHFIKCMGIYPVGSLVRLASGKLGLVLEHNEHAPLQPVVKLIYNASTHNFIDIRPLDLSKPGCNDSIEAAVEPGQYHIDIKRFL